MLKNFINTVDPIEGREKDFTVDKNLGRGSFGTVFLVTRLSDNIKFALKQIDLPEDVHQKMFIDETGTMRKLLHPNIVHLEDFWLRQSGILRGYLLLELCESDLGALLLQVKSTTAVKNNTNPFLGRNDSGLVILEDYFIQALKALDFMSSNGVIHSDIKPDNLFLKTVQDRDVLKVGDFGMAKFGFGSKLAATSFPGGSPAYQAPELRRDKNATPSPSTDIYSLGVSIWQLATLDAPDPSSKIELGDGYASGSTVEAVNAMLDLDSRMRPTASALLRKLTVTYSVRVAVYTHERAAKALKSKLNMQQQPPRPPAALINHCPAKSTRASG
jgi:serine/threonine protein kinase